MLQSGRLHLSGFLAWLAWAGVHRRAYTRGPDRRPIMEMLMGSIDIGEVRFERA